MEPRTVLLVEDNEDLNAINRRALSAEGFTVLTALTLAEAQAHLAACQPEVILLDVILPDGNGIDFCGEIRDDTDAHILFLTSKTEHENRIRGLETGGDDYITKPYKLEEMLSRVRAVMRRRGMEYAKPPEKMLVRGSLRLDIVSGQAFWMGRDLLLTQKEFALLLLLTQKAGHVLTGEALYQGVWGQPLLGDNSALRTQLSRLKGKLGSTSGGAARISGSRGEGYCLEIS